MTAVVEDQRVLEGSLHVERLGFGVNPLDEVGVFLKRQLGVVVSLLVVTQLQVALGSRGQACVSTREASDMPLSAGLRATPGQDVGLGQRSVEVIRERERETAGCKRPLSPEGEGEGRVRTVPALADRHDAVGCDGIECLGDAG